MKSEASGAVQSFVSLGKVRNFVMPVPPLQEQRRIVAKVDELMSLCDQLEQQQTDSISAHQTLVHTLLGALTNASEGGEFESAWTRIAQHFDTLFTTEHSIDQLKQTILQLAVMGKLVPQNPNDEPASVLLKKIAKEKAKLIKEGKIKKQKPLPPISEGEKPFELPDGWVYTRLDDICAWITSGSTPPQSDFCEKEGVPYLKVYNIREQKIDFEYKPQFITPECHEGKLKRSVLYPGDVVMNIVGPPLGKIAIIPSTHPEWNCNQAIAFFRPIDIELNSFLYTYLTAHIFLNYIELIGTAGQDNISVTKSRTVVFPVPPLAEQHRIVCKVEQLMAICDTLEIHIKTAQATQLQLTNAITNLSLQQSLASKPQTIVKSKPFPKGFARQLLAAEILHRHSDNNMTQMKLQKLIHLVEYHAQITEIQGEYQRQAAGPYDNKMMYGLAASLKKQKWFASHGRLQNSTYSPMENAGSHQKYLAHWQDQMAKIDEVLSLLGSAEPGQCEIASTLYAAWNDLLIDGEAVTDKKIILEASQRWHKAKTKIDPEKWPVALNWLREKDLIPTGFGSHTKAQTC